MSDIVTIVDDENFESEVLKSEVPVLVDFGAVWCGPCQRQLPILTHFAEVSSKVKVCKLDVDDAPKTASKFQVRSVPTLMVFNHGVKVGSKVGMSSEKDIEHLVLTSIG